MNYDNEQLNYDYPKLRELEEFFCTDLKNKDFSKIIIIACQHILEPQKVMFQRLISLGFLPKNIFIMGKIYSTNYDVLKEMRSLGMYVLETGFQTQVPFDAQHAHFCKYLLDKSYTARKNAEKVIVLDDGGELITQLALENKTKSVIGIEQTSSGFRKLENMSFSFPVYNVARSKTKLELETPFIVSLGIRRIEEKLQELGWQKPSILIVGLGPIGAEMKDQLLGHEYKVSAYDKIHGEQSISKIVQNDIQVVIGTTGSQILSHDEIVALNESLDTKVLFVSMSSSDREFELWRLRDLFESDGKLHGDVSFGNIIITNNGFPVTFKGNRFEGAAFEMERTICLLFSGVCLAVIEDSLPVGLIDIPEAITEKLV